MKNKKRHQNPPQTGFPVVAFLYPAHSCGLIILLAVPSRVDKQQQQQQQRCIGSFPPAATAHKSQRSFVQRPNDDPDEDLHSLQLALEKKKKRFWRFCCLKTNVCVRQTDWKESSIDDRETRPSKTTTETASVFFDFRKPQQLASGALRAGKQKAKRNASLLPPCRPEG